MKLSVKEEMAIDTVLKSDNREEIIRTLLHQYCIMYFENAANLIGFIAEMTSTLTKKNNEKLFETINQSLYFAGLKDRDKKQISNDTEFIFYVNFYTNVVPNGSSVGLSKAEKISFNKMCDYLEKHKGIAISEWAKMYGKTEYLQKLIEINVL